MASKNQSNVSITGKQQQQQQKQKTQGSQPPPKKDKRSHSDVSNESSHILDTSGIQNQLDEISENLKELKTNVSSVLKKEEIESLITSTITNVMTQMEMRLQKEMERVVEEKTRELQDRIYSLEHDNKHLADTLIKIKDVNKRKFEELEDKWRITEQRSTEAAKRANYNEQYSRKNNIKITNVAEEKEENSEILQTKVNAILEKHGIGLETKDIIAIHRIPSRKTDIKPILIKVINNDVKATVMRKRKELKADGHKIKDDVTILNTGLINRLQLHEEIDSAWFFNGSVYAETHRKERVKFDIYDNISEVIASHRRKVTNNK